MLSDLLEDYKDSDEEEKHKYINDFKLNLWGSNFKFSSYKKSFKYTVNEKSLNHNKELIDLFQKYSTISYRYCKSFYQVKKMKAEDYIRIHINNMYGYLIVKDVYLDPAYYKLLAKPKKLYFDTVRKIKNGHQVDVNEIRLLIETSLSQAEEVKLQSQSKKLNLSLREYKKIINDSIDRIFNNYLTPEEYEDIHGWELKVEHDGWTEDHYVVKYFCKSLTGYMMNYVRDSNKKKEKKCIECSTPLNNVSNRTVRCEECQKKRRKAQNRASFNRWYRNLIS